jgi:sterol 3beta-glucosyltransferase
VDENRFKLRTPERNYTFKADTADGRDEWVKSIQKVMFKTQHEGESVKLIIPLEAVLDVEKSPTLEFAETLEVRCVDSEDQMSVDSYLPVIYLQTIRQSLSRLMRVLRRNSEVPRIPHHMPPQVV